MIETKGIDKMKQARARLIINALFFGSAAINLKLVVDNTPRNAYNTAYTDGKILGFNTDYIDSLSMNTVEALICHETLHCIMLHPLRLQGRDHILANMAMDYVINGILKRAGMTIGENWLYDDELSGKDMSFEIVYELLKKEADTCKMRGRDWQIGEVREPRGDDGQGLSESEKAQIERDWKVNGNKALQAAKAQGKVPYGLERIVGEITITKRDLEDVLRDFVQRTNNGDYSWNRPNKKHIIHDIYLPSVQGESIPQIVMVLDTSGSIGDAELAYFQAKLNSVLMEYPTTVHIIYCDSTAHDGGEFLNCDLPIKLKAIGGGGTDFNPAFELVKKLDIEPSCLIYFTDGYCGSFPDAPEYPVLWALYGQDREFPFGEKVIIQETD